MKTYNFHNSDKKLNNKDVYDDFSKKDVNGKRDNKKRKKDYNNKDRKLDNWN